MKPVPMPAPISPDRCEITPTRRGFLASALAAPVALGAASRGNAMTEPKPERDTFRYEIERSDEEWRALLSDDEYEVLREGWTELPRSSDLWTERRQGLYGCRGCGLHNYASQWQVPLDKGWVFFAHAEPTTVLTDIDGPQAAYGQDPDGPGAMIEARCRRCGSHLGHILIVEGQVLHCINGRALVFSPTEA